MPQQFASALLQWYEKHKRDLPWRNTKDPYRIWLSEIILQQTRVAQGLPYYHKFLAAYPTVARLASATEAEVLKNWQGLGYYSRARNLHATAKKVAGEHKGEFPTTYKGLLQLKGVGDYTASAIASICFNAPTAVVDGNVYRVLARYFGMALPINTTKGATYFKNLAQKLIPARDPGTHNQAIMEFGARHCLPKNPDCTNCIFNASCGAFRLKKVSALPVKLKAAAVKKRYFNYLVFVSGGGNTLLQQRKGRGIWQNLFEFPLVETAAPVSILKLKRHPRFIEIAQGLTLRDVLLYNKVPIRHKLSHQHLYTHFWIVNVPCLPVAPVPIAALGAYAVPVLIQNFISGFFLDETVKK
ncbi:MAG: A/G-specific adenine glycosylase [Marinirhabdus sp.]